MDRMVRARVLLAEATSLGVTVDDLVAASDEVRRPSVAVPTVAAYVDVVDEAIGGTTGATYRPYWRLLVARHGDRPIDGAGYDDCETLAPCSGRMVLGVSQRLPVGQLRPASGPRG